MSSSSETTFSKRRILKNLFVMSIGFLFLYTSYDALFMLQSTMNREQGIGVTCQAIVYCFFCICSLLLPKYIIKKLGSKVTLAIGMFSCVPYVASNFYPHWVVMVPCALLAGFGSATLWASQCTYLNEISVLYARQEVSSANIATSSSSNKMAVSSMGRIMQSSVRKSTIEKDEKRASVGTFLRKDKYSDFPAIANNLNPSLNKRKSFDNNTNETSSEAFQNSQNSLKCDSLSQEAEMLLYSKIVESTTARFFGIHGMAYMSTRIWSNLMSYYVLQKDIHPDNQTSNGTCVCGGNFCNVESECFTHNVEQPSNEVRYILTGVCVVLGLISVLLVAVFLDPLETDREQVAFSTKMAMATLKHAKKKRQVLLIPISFYVGMIQGFYTGDFTKSYIACAWGTYHVGLVSVVYGALSALSSLLSGHLVKRLGRPPILLFAAAVNLASIVVFLLWRPSPDAPALFFVAAGMWGTSTGVFWAQIKAFLGVLFKDDEEAAFGAYYLWYSLGWCLSFAYSNYFCTYVKVYVLLAVSTAGMLGYFTVERSWKSNRV